MVGGDTDVASLWDIANKLVKQLEANRELTQQIVDKTKTLQTGTGVQVVQALQSNEEASRQVEDLQVKVSTLASENFSLQETVREYQATLDVLMSKHRNLAQSWQSERADINSKAMAAVVHEKDVNEVLRVENLQLRERMLSMIQVMRQAASAEEEEVEALTNMEQIVKENETLRTLLGISDTQHNG